MVTGLISPFDVHAASVPGQYDVVDLLASGFFPEGELVQTKAATSYTFNWDVTSSASMAYVYINVYAPTAPSGVTLNGVTGTRVYSGAFYNIGSPCPVSCPLARWLSGFLALRPGLCLSAMLLVLFPASRCLQAIVVALVVTRPLRGVHLSPSRFLAAARLSP